MKPDTLYRKNHQGEFEPVLHRPEDLEDMQYWPLGHHLVAIRPNGRSARYRINPDWATTLATVRAIEDDLVRAVAQADSLRPSVREITPEQRRAWDAMVEAFGEGVYGIRPSHYDIVEALAEALAERIHRAHENNPQLTAARERYQTLVGLAVTSDE